MKRSSVYCVVCSIVAAFSAAMLLAAVRPAETVTEDRQIKALWSKYSALQGSDLPRRQLAVLVEIKTLSLEKRQSVDYYDACLKYANVAASLNWKKRDSLYTALSGELDAYGDPMLPLVFSLQDAAYKYRNKGLDYVKANSSALKSSFHEELQSRDSRFSSETASYVRKDFQNDYNYALWALWLRYNDTLVEAELRDYLAEGDAASSLRQTAILDLLSVGGGDYSAYIEKYAGTVYTLPARDLQIRQRFVKMEYADSSSAAFKALKASCDSLSGALKKLKGDDAEIASLCTNCKSVSEQLDSKELNFSLENLKLSVFTRNISKVDVKVTKDGKTVYKTNLKSSESPYYALDTLGINLPDNLDDGDYTIVCSGGSQSSTREWVRRNLSVSVQDRTDGRYLYVCTRTDGQPVDGFDYKLYNKNDSLLFSGSGSCSEGYFALPQEAVAALNVRYAKSGESLAGKYMVCTAKSGGRSLRSVDVSLGAAAGDEEDGQSSSCRSMIITDCGAYLPGDEVGFKAVCYTFNKASQYSVCPSGTAVSVSLYDSESKLVETRSLVTGEFGSVAGTFVLPEDRRGGMWRLQLSAGGDAIANKRFRVDEFLLPEYTLIFDDCKRAYLSGDRVHVSGVVKAYSGHSLTDAVLQWSAVGQSGTILPADDGRFSLSFVPASKYQGTHSVTVKVVPSDGSTLEFNTSFTICKSLSLGLQLPSDVEDVLDFSINSSKYNLASATVVWEILSGDEILLSGTAPYSANLSCDLSLIPDGRYRLQAHASAVSESGESYRCSASKEFVKFSSKSISADFALSALIRQPDGDDISCLIADSSEPLWAVVQLWSDDRRELGHRLVSLSGKTGDSSAICRVGWDWQDSYPDKVWMTVSYFRHGDFSLSTMSFERPHPAAELPLSITSIDRELAPGGRCNVRLKTSASSEVAVSVFDIATETISSNRWSAIDISNDNGFYFYSFTDFYPGMDRLTSRIKLMRSGISLLTAKAESADYDDMTLSVASAGNVTAEDSDEGEADEALQTEDLTVMRSDFRRQLCFEPFLLPDDSGNVNFSFDASDRLSTYVVQIFAHDKSVKNAVLRENVCVTIPVKLSLVPPVCLYRGDQWQLRASLASTSSIDITGNASLSLYAGGNVDVAAADKLLYTNALKNVSLKGGTSIGLDFGPIPQEIYSALSACGVDTLGVKISFAAQGFSDALFLSVPVMESCQTVTEAHSAVLASGTDRDSLCAVLRSQFINADGSAADYTEISIADMLAEAVPVIKNVENDNALALVNAYCINAAAYKAGISASDSGSSDILARLLDCVTSEGGFSWFKGMSASPAVTAMVLYRLGRSSLDSVLDADVRTAACAYLDRSQFEEANKRLWWRGGIELDSYLLVRSMYADVTLAAKPDRDTRKSISELLVPSTERGLNGAILSKALRLQTLLNLAADKNGLALASSLGIKLSASSKLRKSIAADYASLAEYAVSHNGGGVYYPNAVMPWRGLMESEAFAHSLICDLFSLAPSYVSSDLGLNCLADGIRLWIMLQKETQSWSADPSYTDAILSVLSAGDRKLLDTKVIVLSADVRKPFDSIAAAGNGFTVEVTYSKVASDGSLSLLHQGDVLSVGDKVQADYKVYSTENRSFVRIKAPRPSNLVPVDRLSGLCGGWARMYCGSYRWVRAASTEYWFESFPEETSTISETMFVNSAGHFKAPAVEVECLYAPHYRANGVSLSAESSK